MAEKLLELEDIMLVPSEFNHGCQSDKYNYGIIDPLDNSASLPIFTSPMESIVGKNNWKIWTDNGIKPIIPRTEDLQIRLEACCYIFAAFSIKEVRDCFLLQDRRSLGSQFRICIDPGNGHDIEIFNLGKDLKSKYSNQVILMGGNLGNPKAYIDYSRAGFDYVRVGFSNGSLVNENKFGFYYPMASLLMDIKPVRKSAVGLKDTKVVVDGGITSYVDIIKCIALGADYVMIGREFAKLVEAQGPIFKKGKEGGNILLEGEELENILKKNTLDSVDLRRLYCGNTSYETQAHRDGYDDVHDWMSKIKNKKPVDSRCDWVRITNTLQSWLEGMYDCFAYAFTITDSLNWKTFKEKSSVIRVN